MSKESLTAANGEQTASTGFRAAMKRAFPWLAGAWLVFPVALYFGLMTWHGGSALFEDMSMLARLAALSFVDEAPRLLAWCLVPFAAWPLFNR